MLIRHNRRTKPSLSAAMLTRAEACATYPPGSDAWTRFNCGPAPTPAPPPQYAPTPAPPPQYVPAPPPANIDYDAEYARRVQAAENAQITSQLVADEQARVAAAEAQKAAAAQQKLSEIQAANAASMSALDAGSAGYGFAASSDDSPSASSATPSWVLPVIGAIALLALAMRKRR